MLQETNIMKMNRIKNRKTINTIGREKEKYSEVMSCIGKHSDKTLQTLNWYSIRLSVSTRNNQPMTKRISNDKTEIKDMKDYNEIQ